MIDKDHDMFDVYVFPIALTLDVNDSLTVYNFIKGETIIRRPTPYPYVRMRVMAKVLIMQYPSSEREELK